MQFRFSQALRRLPVSYTPKLASILRAGYSRRDLSSDLVAGLVVGVVALPLAIAFAIASGVSPSRGLATAIVAGFLVSLLGGSRVQIGGPTGAFVVLVFGIVQTHGYDGLVVATVLAGLLLVAAGLLRLGVLAKYVPFPVTVGFTSGIAVIIALGQVPAFLGLRLHSDPADAVDKVLAYSVALPTLVPAAVFIAVLSLACVLLWPRLAKRTGWSLLQRVPGSLVAIAVGTLAVQALGLPVETIGDRFGELPSALPTFALPKFSLALVRQMFQPALAIALLAGIESLLSAVVADGMIGGRHRPNMELVAQGIANTASALFGGIPATGAIARTATNIKNGARTPISGMVHALTLLGILLVFGSWAQYVPLATLAAILLVVAYNMSEWRSFVKLFRAPRSEPLILLATFLLTIIVDLTVALEVGLVMSGVFFIKRMSDATEIGALHRELREEGDDRGLSHLEVEPEEARAATRPLPPGVFAFEVFGPLFFGAIDKFRSALSVIDAQPKVIILRMRHVLAIDASGLNFLEETLLRCKREEIRVFLSAVHVQPLAAMDKSGLLELLGEEGLCGNIEEALDKAAKLVGASGDSQQEPKSKRSLHQVTEI